MIRPGVACGLVLAIALAGMQACGLPPTRAAQAFVYQCQLHPAEVGAMARQPAFADRYFPSCHSLQGLA